MLGKKQKKEILRLKYFPDEGKEGFISDLRDLDKEIADLKKELSNSITVSDVFLVLSMDQRSMLYRMHLENLDDQ